MHDIKTCGRMEEYLHYILTTALHGWKWSVLRLSRFTRGKRATNTKWRVDVPIYILIFPTSRLAYALKASARIILCALTPSQPIIYDVILKAMYLSHRSEHKVVDCKAWKFKVLLGLYSDRYNPAEITWIRLCWYVQLLYRQIFVTSVALNEFVQ